MTDNIDYDSTVKDKIIGNEQFLYEIPFFRQIFNYFAAFPVTFTLKKGTESFSISKFTTKTEIENIFNIKSTVIAIRAYFDANTYLIPLKGNDNIQRVYEVKKNTVTSNIDIYFRNGPEKNSPLSKETLPVTSNLYNSIDNTRIDEVSNKSQPNNNEREEEEEERLRQERERIDNEAKSKEEENERKTREANEELERRLREEKEAKTEEERRIRIIEEEQRVTQAKEKQLRELEEANLQREEAEKERIENEWPFYREKAYEELVILLMSNLTSFSARHLSRALRC